MNAMPNINPDALLAAELEHAITTACKVIAPSWPLDQQIAVNPCWGLIDQPFGQVQHALHDLIGSPLAMPAAQYLHAWEAGDISRAALTRALAEQHSTLSPEQAVSALHAPHPPERGRALFSDLLDQHRRDTEGPLWSTTITQQISQYCASYFDEHQADWHRERGHDHPLFAGWRHGLQVDHALEPLMHAPEIRARAQTLPTSADAAIAWSLARLNIDPANATDFLQTCLLRINGWASWCAYLHWQAALSGSADTHLRQLLAIRACWEALLDDADHDTGSVHAEWSRHFRSARAAASSNAAILPSWQRAQEISYQDQLLHGLQSHQRHAHDQGNSTSAQLVFCIDVRSERLRRALEAADPSLETRGFAGFFGLPIHYTGIGTTHSRPQLPGLLASALEVSDSSGDATHDAAIRRRRTSALQGKAARNPFARLPSGTFSLVETLGLGYVGAILKRHFGATSTAPETLGLNSQDLRVLRPQLQLVSNDALERKTDLAAAILRAMSLTAGFARLVLLVGHGSQSANNPQAAALDCGACCGQTGEINARVLATLLNDAALRAALAQRGIDIPASTQFVAALHNTCTDEVTLFDAALLPASHHAELAQLQRSLVAAGDATRAERAPSLGLAALQSQPATLLKRLRQRGRDWAQTRPEWGLANNAAFIVAPRARSRGLDLQGRSFLHDYTWQNDAQGSVLELIMTAPMIVTHWINMQYYASTVDPERFGSGNKVLHNVACGRIGVFEGNTGDLRVGLSRQSVHDGNHWMHTPLRLTVVIDAPREMIDAVIAKHATVRQLIDNQWLYVCRYADNGMEWRRQTGWSPWSDPAA